MNTKQLLIPLAFSIALTAGIDYFTHVSMHDFLSNTVSYLCGVGFVLAMQLIDTRKAERKQIIRDTIERIQSTINENDHQ